MNEWQLFENAAKTVQRLYLWGPPGIGKSYAGQKELEKNNRSVWQVTLNDDLVVQELLGHFVPNGTHFEWNDGPISMALRQGGGLVINEVARASGAVKDMLLSVLDDPEVSSIGLPTGERLKPKDGFAVVATANRSPEELDEALLDRFDVILQITKPHPEIISLLNTKMRGLGAMIEDSYSDPPRAISPRRAFSFLSLLEKGFLLDDAAYLSFGERHRDVMVLMKTHGGINV